MQGPQEFNFHLFCYLLLETFWEVFSKYVDFWLKNHPIYPSFLPTSRLSMSWLTNSKRNSKQLPTGIKLFSFNAISINSSINTNHEIEVVQKFFKKFKNKFSADCPTAFLLEILTIVMKGNIFQFGDTFWLQLIGCAMRTSAAVNYLYTYIGLLEMFGLVEEYSEYLIFYKWYIDNIIVLWNHSKQDSQAKFDKFFKQLNQWEKLCWTTTGFNFKLIFMDLSISIRKKRLHFKAYQKEHNLYL